MKLKQIALAVLAAGACVQVQAQAPAPKIEVFGAFDMYVESYSNGANSTTRVSSGGLGASHLGIRGSEDLGGGLRAFFMLDSAFMGDNGTNSDAAVQGALFNRTAYVGLAGSFGEVRLGKQITPHFISALGDCAADGALASGVSQFLAPMTGINGSFNPQQLPGPVLNVNDERNAFVENSFSYSTPRWHGLKATGLVSLGEDKESSSAGNLYNLGLHYRQGGMSAYASYLQRESRNIVDNTERYYAVSASYDFGFIKPALNYIKRSSSVDRHTIASGPMAGETFNAPEVTVMQLGASAPLWGGRLIGNVASLSNSRDVDADAITYGVRFDYPLSKRTTLYTGAQVIRNEANANYAIAATGFSSAPVAGVKGDDPRTTFVGIRHRF